MIEAEEKVRVIQENLRAAQSRQKSYSDKRRKPLKFKVGDCWRLPTSPSDAADANLGWQYFMNDE